MALQMVGSQSSINVIKVSARSRTASVAGAIAGIVREAGRAEVQAIGAGAVNQAVKAIAIARSYLIEESRDIFCVPSFIEVEIDGAERTALRMLVQEREQPVNGHRNGIDTKRNGNHNGRSNGHATHMTRS